MAARCHGICSRLPHEKVVRWLSVQMKKLFRFCSKCQLFIHHPIEERFCKCCGCRLRRRVHSRNKKMNRNRDNRIHNRIYRAKNKEYISNYNKEYYRKKGKAKKQEYYQNNYDKVRQQWRLYRLKTKLIKIFFITLYPNLLLERNVGYSVRPPQISL